LAQVLCQLSSKEDPNLLVGSSTSDDAAVYRLNDDLALVQTVDYFTPVVDDPYTFGQIAAANALSDIYAMGAKPLLALNIIGFPIKLLPLEIMVEILKGGADKVKEAGAVVAGGHTIEDNEPKYGLAVTGLIHPGRVIKNAGAHPGDVLILTKPLGTGIINTAVKGKLADEPTRRAAVEVMTALNDRAAGIMFSLGVSACTDITGFGLLGHLYEMLSASGVGGLVYLKDVPVLEQVRALAEIGLIPGGAYRNLEYLEEWLRWDEDIDETDRLILTDPQTSGGLLMAVSRKRADEAVSALRAEGVTGVKIGEIIESSVPLINVKKQKLGTADDK
jgi:selenide,water dikinase